MKLREKDVFPAPRSPVKAIISPVFETPSSVAANMDVAASFLRENW
jgi:hypothetical protein